MYEGIIPALENLALSNVLEPFICRTLIHVSFYRINSNIADFKGREVLRVNSPMLFCVQIVIIEHTLLQNIVPCG